MDDPYEVVEATIDENGWSVVARGEHGVTFLVEGRLGKYICNFLWRDIETLLVMSCSFPVEVSALHVEQIRILTARINEHLLVGHFTFTPEGNVVSYRYSLLLPEDEECSPAQCSGMIASGLRYSGLFRSAFIQVSEGFGVEEALAAALIHTSDKPS